MPHRALKHLHDILEAASFIDELTKGRTLEVYLQDRMLRSAVERQFEIAGEALNRLRKTHPEIADQLSDSRGIVKFRNLLIHGYDYVNNIRVWQVIERDLPVLLQEIAQLVRRLEQEAHE